MFSSDSFLINNTNIVISKQKRKFRAQKTEKQAQIGSKKA
jgi:hypothetical protein